MTWTDAKNARRCELIDLDITEGLTPEEWVELRRLQTEMERHRHQVAPLPLEKLRELRGELEE